MAALCGLFHADATPVAAHEQALVAAMLARLANRSRDGSGVVAAGGACLGQGLFWTSIDRPRQSGVAVREGLALAGDIRLDDRGVLAAALAVDPAAASDADLILAAYARWQDDCVDHLLGDFAFALIDEGQGRLFCARDHFGIKPFFYATTSAGLLFASEAKALFASAEVCDDWDEESLADFVAPHIEDPSRTLFKRDPSAAGPLPLVLDAQVSRSGNIGPPPARPPAAIGRGGVHGSCSAGRRLPPVDAARRR